jgi:hypothetical protein
MQLSGTSIRQAYAEIGQESLWKGFERVKKLQLQFIPPTVARAFSRLVQDAPATPFVNLLVRAFDGDKEAQAAVAALPSWEAMLEGLRSNQEEVWPIRLIEALHFMEIERASRQVDVLLSKHAFADAVLAWREVPELQPYLREEALISWSCASSLVETLPAQTAGMCELLLSQVVRAEYDLADYGLAPGNFASLLLAASENKCRPGREFMRWMMNALKLRSQGELLEVAHSMSSTPDEEIVHESTLKAWCAGTNFPSENLIRQIFEAVATQRFSGAELLTLCEAAGLRYWAARRFMKLLELVEFIARRDQLQGYPVGFMDLLGAHTPREWIVSRFNFWHGYWGGRQAARSQSDRASARTQPLEGNSL